MLMAYLLKIKEIEEIFVITHKFIKRFGWMKGRITNHNLRSYWIIELSEHGTENPRQMTLSMIGFFSMTTNVDGVSYSWGRIFCLSGNGPSA